MLSKNIEVFMGCDWEPEEADTILFGAPFDSTTSYRPGTRFGSGAIRHEAYGLEDYSPYQDKDLSQVRAADIGDLELCIGDTEKVLEQIEACAGEILAAGEELGFLPLRNSGAAEGISASVRLGLSAMEDLDGVLFSVSDQPYLTTESIIRMLDVFRELKTSLCALSWRGRRGNPVVFPRDLFGELAALTGDVGGGAVIRRHPERLILVEAATPRELADVDTPADLPQ